MKIKAYEVLDDDELIKAKIVGIRNVHLHLLELEELQHLGHITAQRDCILPEVQSIITKLEKRYEENRKVFLQD